MSRAPAGNAAPMAEKTTHRVAVLVRQGVLPMELGLAHQLFGNATARSGKPLYTMLTCAVAPGMIRTDADFPIYAPHGPKALASADTVIVPSSHEEDEYLSPGRLPNELAEALDLARGARVASICTGTFVLAAAGLLDGLRATTHWLSTDLFARTFPAVTVDPDVLYVDEGRVLTSAGEAAGIDLCLHMIRRDHGSAVAADVARRTVVPPHQEGGQAQYIQRPVSDGRSTGSTTSASRAWAPARLDEPLPLRELAARDAMSVRTYSRRFREETASRPCGGSPSDASTGRVNCWNTPATRSTASRRRRASVPARPAGGTSRRRWGCHRPRTGRRSAAPSYDRGAIARN